MEIAVGKRIFEAALKGDLISKDQLFTQAELVKLKGQFLAAKKKDLPPIVTHNIIDGDVRECSFFERKTRRKKNNLYFK
jgi:hypothetical protein